MEHHLKRLSCLLAAAAAAILSTNAVQAAPKKIIENDVTVYSIDTYKSQESVEAILSKAFDVKSKQGGSGDGAILSVAKPVGNRDAILAALGDIGTPQVKQVFKTNSRNGKPAPFSATETLRLANGSDNGKPLTRDVQTGFFAKTTTFQKNGEFKISYEQRNVDVVDVKNAMFAGGKYEVALVQDRETRTSARVKQGESIILSSFSKETVKGLFGRKNRVLVTFVTPRAL